MSRRLVIPALLLAAALGLAGCSADASDPQAVGGGASADGSTADGTASNGSETASSQNTAEVVAAIDQAAAEMMLGFDFAALDEAAVWTAATYYAQEDGTRYMSLQAGRDQLDGIVAWIDAQDWDGWLIQDTEPGAEAMGKFRFLDSSSFTLQELLDDHQSIDVQFYDAE